MKVYVPNTSLQVGSPNLCTYNGDRAVTQWKLPMKSLISFFVRSTNRKYKLNRDHGKVI